jgi:hypothetical protein
MLFGIAAAATARAFGGRAFGRAGAFARLRGFGRRATFRAFALAARFGFAFFFVVRRRDVAFVRFRPAFALPFAIRPLRARA